MGMDLSFLLGLDDSEFRSKLRENENEVSRIGGRIGGLIRSQTGGLQALTSSITGIIGTVTSAVGAAALIGGTVYAGYSLIRDWANESERAAKAAEEELRRREGIERSIQTSLLRQDVRTGRASGVEGDIRAIEDEFEALRKRLGEEYKINDVLDERRRIIEDTAQAASVRERRTAQSSSVLAGSSAATAFEQDIAARAANLAQYESRLAELEEREARIVEYIREQAEARAESMEAQSRLNLLTLAGNTLAADQMKESLRHEEQLRKIQEIALQSEERAQLLRDLENDIHENRMRQIEEEEQARKDAQAERAKRAEEQARRERDREQSIARSNETLAEQQKLERLRLTDQEEAAKAYELELEHRRNIYDLEHREGLDDSARRRLIEAENELFGLRQQRLAESPAASFGALRSSTTLLGGGFADSTLARQVFGSGGASDASPAAKNTRALDKNSQVLERIEVWLRDVARNGAGVGLV